jgi:uncharacterized protein HemX
VLAPEQALRLRPFATIAPVGAAVLENETSAAADSSPGEARNSTAEPIISEAPQDNGATTTVIVVAGVVAAFALAVGMLVLLRKRSSDEKEAEKERAQELL